MATADSLTELPKVVSVPDQPCQQLYEANPVLLGFDVVHYHFIPSYKDGGVAKQGSPEYAYNFHGYQFWFSSEENRNLFIGDPWKYAPAWGGYCSWALALDTRPRTPWAADFLGPGASPWEGWVIVDGVLVFNIRAQYSDWFLEDVDTNMKLAAERWKGFFNGELQAGPFNTHCIGHGSLENWCLTQQPSPWLEPLPTCTTSTDMNVTAGGGIVSTLDDFDDFGNSMLTSRQRMWVYLVAFGVLSLCVVSAFRFVCAKSESEKKISKLDDQQDGSSEETTPRAEKEEDEDSVDELPLCWQ